MKNTLSSLLLALLSYPAIAQDSARNYTLLNIEAGASLVGVGGIYGAGGSSSKSINDGIAVSPTLILRGARIFKRGWGVGLRAEVASWSSKSEVTVTDANANPVGTSKFTFYYAAPAISIAPEVSKILLHGRNELSLGAYIGVVFSTHKEGYFAPISGPAINSVYSPPSTGLQYGAEVQYRYWIKPRFAISASTGFQRNSPRYNDRKPYGFNLNTVPVTVGISFRLYQRRRLQKVTLNHRI